MYHFIDKLHTLYGLLGDQQSKEIFQARFALDMDPSVPNINHLASLGSCQFGQSQKEVLEQLNREHKKIIFYGANTTGQDLAKLLEFEHIDFYGFCGRRAERYADGLLGKPVLSPDELVNSGEYYVIPTILTEKNHTEIMEFLRKGNYPEDHILDLIYPNAALEERQYFEFPALYHRGTAFIDGGCYDCASSYRFMKWCEGEYSSIIAFEPDPGNYAACCEKARDFPLPNFQLVNAGLSAQEGTAVFESQNTMGSRIVSDASPAIFEFNQSKIEIDDKISVRTAAIDDVVGERTVGFIKMDIEGAEFDALHGAKNTIVRDKPLLAICVYHLRGDTFAIMDYLHQLLPEYRFLLRHYTLSMVETVLYASVDL